MKKSLHIFRNSVQSIVLFFKRKWFEPHDRLENVQILDDSSSVCLLRCRILEQHKEYNMAACVLYLFATTSMVDDTIFLLQQLYFT